MSGNRLLSSRFALIWIFLFCQLTAQTDLRIAVLDFQNLTGREDMKYLEKAIPQILITDLTICKKITIVERTRLQEIMNEMQLALSGIIDEESAVEVGEMAGANAILVGSIIFGDKTYRIDSRLVDVASGEVILAEKKGWLSEDEIIIATDELAQQIIQKVTGESIDIKPDSTYEPPTFIEDRTLSMETALDKPVWLNGSDEPVYLRVDIYSKDVPQRERIPLNIALVLDRSGSMATEGKMDNVKEAAKFVVRNLKRDDILSLVTYESNVQVVVPAQKIRNKNKIISFINNLNADGSTNLSGGMLQGYSEVAKYYKTGQVNRVLLLSDGLANVGITRSDKLQELCNGKTSSGMSLSTFGVGADFDEDLLQGLSDRGKGNYYFIGSSERIPNVFTSEMTGLLAIAAQNVKVDVKIAPGVSVEKVYGFLSATEDNRTEIALGDVFSNDHLTITIQLRLPGAIRDSLQLARVSLSYDDVANQGNRIDDSAPIWIEGTSDPVRKEQFYNPRVGERIVLLRTTQEIQTTIAGAKEENIAETRAELGRQLTAVSNSAVQYKSTDLKKQILSIAKYDQTLETIDNRSKGISTDVNATKYGSSSSMDELNILRKTTKYEAYQQERGKNPDEDKFEIPKKVDDNTKEIKPEPGIEPEPEPKPVPLPAIEPVLPIKSDPSIKQKSEDEKKNIEKPSTVPVKPDNEEVKNTKTVTKEEPAESKTKKEVVKPTPHPAKPAESKEKKPAETKKTKAEEPQKKQPEKTTTETDTQTPSKTVKEIETVK